MKLFFIHEIYFKPAKKIYSTNKTDVHHINDISSLDILDLTNYGPENNRGYRYFLVLNDKFNKFGWVVGIRNKNAITITNAFE